MTHPSSERSSAPEVPLPAQHQAKSVCPSVFQWGFGWRRLGCRHEMRGTRGCMRGQRGAP